MKRFKQLKPDKETVQTVKAGKTVQAVQAE
jgi:hypothetical protein